MELKKTTMLVHKVRSSDLHEFIESKINRKCVVFSYRDGGDFSSQFSVSKLTEVEDFNIANEYLFGRVYSDQWKAYKEGKLLDLHPGILLDGLCEDGYLEPGMYLVLHEK